MSFRPIARLPLWLGTLFVSLICMSGCKSDEQHFDRAAFQRNRTTWQASALTSYHFLARRSCFCGPPQEVVVTVTDSQLTNVTAVAASNVIPPDPSDYYTIDGLFSMIADAADRGADEIDVAYDPELGYPASIVIDNETDSADDEITYDAWNLTID